MFKEVMDHNTVIDLPLVALVVFIAIFALVVLRVWKRGKDDARFVYLSQLPLADDDVIVEAPSPSTRSKEGAHHE